MHCPQCLIDLKSLTTENTTMDICPQCHGIFLDQGEILKLAAIPLPKIQEILFTQNKTTNFKQSQEKLYENEIPCPKCQQLI
ncbi:MAG: zf-TFIIB domain-containing protein [candidate division WOR-3 bacterium]